MRLTILAVGRLRAGPEADLVADYLARASRAGRSLGLGPAQVVEVEARRGGGAAEEAALLLARLPDGADLVALDERGRGLSSPDFAAHLRRRADAGVRDLCIAIGGADGLDPGLRARAGLVLSLGPMVWPHLLVRAMIAEQIYRAVSILEGSPYHRA